MPKIPPNVLRDSLKAELAAAAAEKEFIIDERAVRELDAGLTEALVYRDMPALADSPSHDRLVSLQALNTVIRFLQAHDQWRAGSAPLALIQAALLDLGKGHVSPMLRPVPVERGRPVSGHETRLRGFAAGIMEGLMKHAHITGSQAAEWVSKRLSAAGSAVAPGTVISWRKDAMKRKANPEQHQAYSSMLAEAGWSDPHACAERLVAGLIALQTQKGGKPPFSPPDL